jgi:hypothetical protein
VGVEDAFEKKVRAAVEAGWRALVVGVAFLTVVWFVYLAIIRTRAHWMAWLLGPEVTWSTLTTVSLWAMAALKIGLYGFALLEVWGAFWVRRLRKLRDPAPKVREEKNAPALTPSPAGH